MIIKSRVTGKHVLDVFENFSVDRSLPKHAEAEAKRQNSYKNITNMVSSFDDGEDSVDGGWGNSINGSTKTPWTKFSWRHSIVVGMEKLLRIHRPKNEMPSGKTNPMQILLSVRGNLKEAQDYTNRLKLYDEVIQQARTAGQTARVEQLMSARKIVKWESLLMVSGFGKYLSEDTAIEFAVKCQKGLRLDWIANFARPVPVDVIQKKVEADKLMVFDNYVVMHYDPRGEAFVLTKAQEEAKKDPILFGVVKNVRKLYFIGDWKDDECSLTMDEVETVLGRKSSVISNNPSEEAV